MVASAATITPEREGTVAFSVPYFAADQSLMVKKGSDIKTVDDVDGKVIGAQLGTTGAAYAKDKTKAETVRTYDLIDDAFKALQTEQIEAVINDFPVSKYAEESKPDLVVVQRIETGEEYGLAFAKESTKLRSEVRRVIEDMKKDGTFTEIYKKWFKEDPPDELFTTTDENATGRAEAAPTEPTRRVSLEKGACRRPSYFSQTTPAHWRRSPLRAARFRPPSVTWMPASMPRAAL